jgi:hypothetical protein
VSLDGPRAPLPSADLPGMTTLGYLFTPIRDPVLAAIYHPTYLGGCTAPTNTGRLQRLRSVARPRPAHPRDAPRPGRQARTTRDPGR